jgi:hypothetical protein
MSWYTVIKTVKGRRYRYKQRTWREGNRVRTESVYLGALDGGAPRPRKQKAPGVLRKVADFINANLTPPGAYIVDEQAMLRQQEAREKAEKVLIVESEQTHGVRGTEQPRAISSSHVPAATGQATPDAMPGDREAPSAKEVNDEGASDGSSTS